MACKQTRWYDDPNGAQFFTCETTDMMCSSCGRAVLVPGTRDWQYEWDGYETLIPAVTGLFCPECNDVVTCDEHSVRLEDLMLVFRNGVVEGRRMPSGYI